MHRLFTNLYMRLLRLLGRTDLPPRPGRQEIEQAMADRVSASDEERAAADAAAKAVLERLQREERD
jgi:hypothetical protein